MTEKYFLGGMLSPQVRACLIVGVTMASRRRDAMPPDAFTNGNIGLGVD